MRKLIKLFVLLIVLIIAGVVLAFFYIDSIAKAAVERGSTYALGVNTTLKSASVKILDGQFVMKGLEVANPQGYATAHFLSLGTGDVSVTLGSLRQPIIDLPHLKLSKLDLNLERKDGKANYQVILDNLKKLESGSKAPDPKDTGTRYKIDKLTIRNTNVHADALPIGGQMIDVPLEDIALKNIGNDGKGVTMGELTSIIIKSILTATIDKAGDRLPKELIGDLSTQLAGLKNISDVIDLDKLPGNLGTIGDKAKDAA